ncbi:hypothetical protein A5661_03270 [Mycobacterium asiaticum]|nr:hypothetical protein A5661_03270 [Mycobacterium asiaticum]
MKAELAGNIMAAQRPGLVAIALAMARIMDNPHAIPQQPAAAGRLIELLGKLSKGQPLRGRLAAVQAMTTSANGARFV